MLGAVPGALGGAAPGAPCGWVAGACGSGDVGAVVCAIAGTASSRAAVATVIPNLVRMTEFLSFCQPVAGTNRPFTSPRFGARALRPAWFACFPFRTVDACSRLAIHVRQINIRKERLVPADRRKVVGIASNGSARDQAGARRATSR